MKKSKLSFFWERYVYSFLPIILISFTSLQAQTTYFSSGNGDWDDDNTWYTDGNSTPGCCGAPDHTSAVQNVHVVIQSGDTVTYSYLNRRIMNLTIEAGGVLAVSGSNKEIQIHGDSMQLYGDIIDDGAGTEEIEIVLMNDVSLVLGNSQLSHEDITIIFGGSTGGGTISGTGVLNTLKITKTASVAPNSSVEIYGRYEGVEELQIGANAHIHYTSDQNFSNSALITLLDDGHFHFVNSGGIPSNNENNFIGNNLGSTVYYEYTGSDVVIENVPYSNLVIGSGVNAFVPKPNSRTLSVNEDLTVYGTFNLSDQDTVLKEVEVIGTTSIESGGSLIVPDNNKNVTFNHLIVNSNGSYSVPDDENITINGDWLSYVNATVAAGTGLYTFTGGSNEIGGDIDSMFVQQMHFDSSSNYTNNQPDLHGHNFSSDTISSFTQGVNSGLAFINVNSQRPVLENFHGVFHADNDGNTVTYKDFVAGIRPLNPSSHYYNYTLDASSGGQALVLDDTLFIENHLELVLGHIYPFNKRVVLLEGATASEGHQTASIQLAGGDNAVIKRLGPTDTNVINLPIGYFLYDPITIEIVEGSYAPGAYLEITIQEGPHPDLTNPDTRYYLYWEVTAHGITGPTRMNISYQFDDFSSAYEGNKSDLYAIYWDGSEWRTGEQLDTINNEFRVLSTTVFDSASTVIFTGGCESVAPAVFTSCPGDTSVSSTIGLCGAPVSWTLPTFDLGLCGAGIDTMYSTHSPGDTFSVGITEVIYTLVNKANDTATCSFFVTVTDIEAPVFTSVPVGNIVSTDSVSCNVAYSWSNLLASDNCGIDTIITSPASGSIFPLGNTTVTATATDIYGNTSDTSFVVTVVDDIQPVFSSCPSDIVLNASFNRCDTVATWTPPSATDNCNNISSITSSHLPGDTFLVGTTEVIYIATDAAGNQDTCSFFVTVNDTISPVINDMPADITVSNDPGNCSTVVTWTSPTTTDICDTLPLLTSDYNSGDTFPVGSTTVTYTATDNSGNSVSATFTITVVDTEGPAITDLRGDTTIYSGTGVNCFSTNVSWADPVANDNCGTVSSFSGSHASGASFSLGSTTVTYTAIDDAGNISIDSFIVTLLDTTPPVINNMPADIDTNLLSGQCETLPLHWTLPTADDNCSLVSFTATNSPGEIFDEGVTVVTYTAIDHVGNVTEASFTITVNDLDNVAPEIDTNTCPPQLVKTCSPMVAYHPLLPNVNDNCEYTLHRYPYDIGALIPENISKVDTTVEFFYVATDPSGNADTACYFDIQFSTLPDKTIEVLEDINIYNCEAVAIGFPNPERGYEYLWHPPEGLDSVTISNPTFTFPNTLQEERTFRVFITDTATLCTRTEDVTISLDLVNGTEVGRWNQLNGLTPHLSSLTDAFNIRYRYGSAAGNADINNDGLPELIVGIPGSDVYDPNDACGGGCDEASAKKLNRGEIIIHYLNPDLSGKITGVSRINALEGNFTGDLDDTDNFGAAVKGIGDLDGDGIEDLAVGAPLDDPESGVASGKNLGAVWILFMDSNGTVKSHQRIAENEGGFTGNLDNNDRFGSGIEVLHDFAGVAGQTVLLVGATGDDDSGTEEGAFWSLFLNSDGTVSSSNKILLPVVNKKELYGSAITAVGDLDNDGIEDIIVGTEQGNYLGSKNINIGAVYAIYLQADGSRKNSVKIAPTSGNINYLGLEAGDFFGSSLASLGDLDNDSIPEIIVGSQKHDVDNDGTNHGALFVLFLNQTLDVKDYFIIDPVHGNFVDSTGVSPVAREFNLGASVTVLGDLDGNCIPDIAMGATDDDYGNGNGEFGSMFVAFLKDRNDNSFSRIRLRSNKTSDEIPIVVEERESWTMSLFPNPTNGIVHVHGVNSEYKDSEVSIEVYSIYGQKVHEWNGAYSGEFTHSIDLSQSSNGQYLLRVQVENDVISKHFMLNK